MKEWLIEAFLLTFVLLLFAVAYIFGKSKSIEDLAKQQHENQLFYRGPSYEK